MEKEDLNECLTMFYASVRREDGTEFKVIREAIDRYLRQPPNNKPWSIVGDSAFQKSYKVLNAICKQMMQEGKVGPTIHKNPITSEQLQQLYETGQLGEWDTLDPSQLLRTAWYYITFYFGKRGREKVHLRHVRTSEYTSRATLLRVSQPLCIQKSSRWFDR